VTPSLGGGGELGLGGSWPVPPSSEAGFISGWFLKQYSIKIGLPVWVPHATGRAGVTTISPSFPCFFLFGFPATGLVARFVITNDLTVLIQAADESAIASGIFNDESECRGWVSDGSNDFDVLAGMVVVGVSSVFV